MIRVFLRGTLLILIALMAVPGCTTATVGNQSLTHENIAKITKGVTTRTEVELILGEPDYVAMLPDGGRMMNYTGSQMTAGYWGSIIQSVVPFGALVPVSDTETARRQMLQIKLNSNNVVEDFEYGDNGSETVLTASAFGARSETKSLAAVPTTQSSSN